MFNKFDVQEGLDGFQSIADMANQGQKNDPSGTPVAPYGHGANGLFNIPGTNNRIFGAFVLPRGGILDRMPVYQSDPLENDEEGTLFGARSYDLDTLLTGITEGDAESIANQPTTECADGAEGGLMKLCTIVNTLSRYKFKTREASMYRTGLRQDRLDPMTLTLVNESQPLSSVFGTPSMTPSASNTVMNEMSKRMYESAVSARRLLSRRVWVGSPANNSGTFRDIVGMNIHINAGNKVDYRSSAVCTAANSTVLDFGYDLVGGTGRDIVQYLEQAEYVTMENASRMGLSDVSGFIAMRQTLFREITGVYPVRQYQEVIASLNAMPNADGTRLVIDATGAQRERNSFRTGYMLPINGKMYEIVVDDGIDEENSTTNANLAAGQFASDIYFIPLTAAGGLPVSYFTFYNHANDNSEGLIRQVAPNVFTFTSDGGLFRWYCNFKDGCVYMNYELSAKLHMKTPMVAWRISNVAYEPAANLQTRSPYPDSDYFVNGGITEQPSRSTLYTPWSPTTPTSI